MTDAFLDGMSQQFHKGDWVRVAKDLGDSMRHFPADCEAIVIGSYKDQFGGGNTNNYTLYLKNHGECSWYQTHQLTLIKQGRTDLLKQWKAKINAEIRKKSDLDWIFRNGPDVLNHPTGASIEALAACFGMTNLWGNHGEGFIYYENAMMTLHLAAPYLKNKDKAGWLSLCEGNKS